MEGRNFKPTVVHDKTSMHVLYSTLHELNRYKILNHLPNKMRPDLQKGSFTKLHVLSKRHDKWNLGEDTRLLLILSVTMGDSVQTVWSGNHITLIRHHIMCTILYTDNLMISQVWDSEQEINLRNLMALFGKVWGDIFPSRKLW